MKILLISLLLFLSTACVAQQGSSVFVPDGDVERAVTAQAPGLSDAYQQIKQGAVEPLRELGMLLYRTDNDQFRRESMRMILHAAERGDAMAQTLMGLSLESGNGIDKDLEQAKKWFRKAASQNQALAMQSLAVMNKRVKKYRRAHKWYSKCAKLGDVDCQTALALQFLHGQGAAQNSKQAARWFFESAEQGDVSAKLHLGYMYAEGNGVELNPGRAYYWTSEAAEAGNADAQFNLSYMYANGFGVERNDRKANYWYQLSQGGNPMQAEWAAERGRQQACMSRCKIPESMAFAGPGAMASAREGMAACMSSCQ